MQHSLKLKIGETGLNFERLIGSDFSHDRASPAAPAETAPSRFDDGKAHIAQ
jgi:hypothetical protein